MNPLPPGEVPAPTPPEPGAAAGSGSGGDARRARSTRDRRQRPTSLSSVLAEVGDLAGPVAAPPDASSAPTGRHGDDHTTSAGARPAPAARQLRRRRSASALPPPPRPADLPEDAAGRVEFITVATVAIPEPASSEAMAPAPEEPTAVAAAGTPPPGVVGWIPLLILGGVLVAIFVAGILATR